MDEGIKRKTWLRLNEASEYASVSNRTLRYWLTKGLRRVKVGRVVLIRRSDIDAFIEKHADEESRVDEIVNEAVAGL